MKKSDKKALAEKIYTAVLACLERNAVTKAGDTQDVLQALVLKLTNESQVFLADTNPPLANIEAVPAV